MQQESCKLICIIYFFVWLFVVSLKMLFISLYILQLKKNTSTGLPSNHTKFPCCFFQTGCREFWCRSHCSTPGSSLISLSGAVQKHGSWAASDLFQKCVSHAQWESWLWRWTWVGSTAVVTPEHVPQVLWYSRAWRVLIQWKKGNTVTHNLHSFSYQCSLLWCYTTGTLWYTAPTHI